MGDLDISKHTLDPAMAPVRECARAGEGGS